MGDAGLTAVLIRYIDAVVAAAGDARVSDFFFTKQWTHGCAGHPDLREDQKIAGELINYLRGLMSW
jgi:hypothetical protein